jgi:hypothetical protein
MSEGQQEALLMLKSNLVFSRAEPKHKQVCVCGGGVLRVESRPTL